MNVHILSEDDIRRIIREELALFFNKDMEDSQNNKAEEFLTTSQACDLLKCNRGTLLNYQKQGKIKAYGFGKRRFFKKNEIIERLTQKK